VKENRRTGWALEGALPPEIRSPLCLPFAGVSVLLRAQEQGRRRPSGFRGSDLLVRGLFVERLALPRVRAHLLSLRLYRSPGVCFEDKPGDRGVFFVERRRVWRTPVSDLQCCPAVIITGEAVFTWCHVSSVERVAGWQAQADGIGTAELSQWLAELAPW